jgi:hypothetical protein
MGVKQVFTKKEAREICRRLGLSEIALSNDTCIVAQNDKGHIYKFPIGVPGKVEVTNKPVVNAVKEEKVEPEKPVKRKRGRPPKKKKVEETE